MSLLLVAIKCLLAPYEMVQNPYLKCVVFTMDLILKSSTGDEIIVWRLLSEALIPKSSPFHSAVPWCRILMCQEQSSCWLFTKPSADNAMRNTFTSLRTQPSCPEVHLLGTFQTLAKELGVIFFQICCLKSVFSLIRWYKNTLHYQNTMIY